MQRVQIPRRRGHEVTYTACLLPSSNLLSYSSLPPHHNMEFLSASGGRSQKYKLRAGETHAGGVIKTGGITDFIWATAGLPAQAGTICRGSYNFESYEIFADYNYGDCVIK